MKSVPTPGPTPGPPGVLVPALTDTLCTQCGLCCDGTLFADVELGRAEAARLENMGLEVEVTDGGLLSQPCAALKGRRCSIYAHRPKCCRTFECQLLHRLISSERVGVALRQPCQLAAAALDMHDNRRRETAIDGQQGRFFHAVESDRLPRLIGRIR